MAPFFASDLKSEYLDISSGNLTFRLPEILDSDEDLCTIEIDSVTLGSTFFTNISHDVSSDEFMSYDIETNMVSLKLPIDSREGFKGEHSQ